MALVAHRPAEDPEVLWAQLRSASAQRQKTNIKIQIKRDAEGGLVFSTDDDGADDVCACSSCAAWLFAAHTCGCCGIRERQLFGNGQDPEESQKRFQEKYDSLRSVEAGEKLIDIGRVLLAFKNGDVLSIGTSCRDKSEGAIFRSLVESIRRSAALVLCEDQRCKAKRNAKKGRGESTTEQKGDKALEDAVGTAAADAERHMQELLAMEEEVSKSGTAAEMVGSPSRRNQRKNRTPTKSNNVVNDTQESRAMQDFHLEKELVPSVDETAKDVSAEFDVVALEELDKDQHENMQRGLRTNKKDTQIPSETPLLHVDEEVSKSVTVAETFETPTRPIQRKDKKHTKPGKPKKSHKVVNDTEACRAMQDFGKQMNPSIDETPDDMVTGEEHQDKVVHMDLCTNKEDTLIPSKPSLSQVDDASNRLASSGIEAPFAEQSSCIEPQEFHLEESVAPESQWTTKRKARAKRKNGVAQHESLTLQISSCFGQCACGCEGLSDASQGSCTLEKRQSSGVTADDQTPEAAVTLVPETSSCTENSLYVEHAVEPTATLDMLQLATSSCTNRELCAEHENRHTRYDKLGPPPSYPAPRPLSLAIDEVFSLAGELEPASSCLADDKLIPSTFPAPKFENCGSDDLVLDDFLLQTIAGLWDCPDDDLDTWSPTQSKLGVGTCSDSTNYPDWSFNNAFTKSRRCSMRSEALQSRASQQQPAWSPESVPAVAPPMSPPWQLQLQALPATDSSLLSGLKEQAGPIAVNLRGLPPALCHQNFLEAMLDQAGLADDIIVCSLGEDHEAGTAVIYLGTYSAAAECMRHFGGRRWAKEGPSVTAEMAKGLVLSPPAPSNLRANGGSCKQSNVHNGQEQLDLQPAALDSPQIWAMPEPTLPPVAFHQDYRVGSRCHPPEEIRWQLAEMIK